MGNLKLADYKTKFACEVEIENFRDWDDLTILSSWERKEWMKESTTF
jgi:hypothetical protein